MEIANGLIIRKAVRQDCPKILTLIKEMYLFLKQSDAVEIDVSALEKDGFDGEHPLYYSIVAEDPNSKDEDGQGKLAGYCVYLDAYCTWYGKTLNLEDIYVTESYRSKKVGSALFDFVNKIAVDTGCSSIDWHVRDWNSEAREFYHRKGAVNITEVNGMLIYRLPKEAMLALYRQTTARLRATVINGQ